MKEEFYKINSKSFKTKNASNVKELWENVKKEGYKGLAVELKTKFVKSESKDNKFHATFSSPSVDRHGDIVEQNWDLKHFKNNPVYLDSHNYGSIERIIGRVDKPRVKDGKLVGSIVFALDNPLGELAYKLADGGFLNTSSVGFIPKEFDDKFEKIVKSELLEISAVSVPANPEALLEKEYDTSKKQGEEVEETEGDTEAEDDNGEVQTDEKSKCEGCKVEEEEEADEVIEVKSNPSDKLKKAIAKEIEIKEKALLRILTATKLLSDATKGRSCQQEKQSVNNTINRAVKNLLKMKIK